MTKPNLTPKEAVAFQTVRGMLASGMIQHKKEPNDLPWASRDFIALSMKRFFNMSYPSRTTECGSVCCIGGWVGTVLGMTPPEINDFVDHSRKFRQIFYPPSEIDYDTITPAQAVEAIDNFMKDGNPRWEKIVRKNQYENS